MGSVNERKYPSGRVQYRVRIRKRGVRSFHISFDSFSEACTWMEKNEKEFFKDPDKYFRWRENLYYKMQRERKKSYESVIRTKVRH